LARASWRSSGRGAAAVMARGTPRAGLDGDGAVAGHAGWGGSGGGSTTGDGVLTCFRAAGRWGDNERQDVVGGGGCERGLDAASLGAADPVAGVAGPGAADRPGGGGGGGGRGGCAAD